MTTLPSLNFNESSVLTALRTFLLSAVNNQIEVIQGQQSRVPQPVGPDYMVFWPILRTRLETNWDVYGDCLFTGQVSGSVLTVLGSATIFGLVQVGGNLYGSAVPAGIVITTQLTGSAGGTGTYGLNTTGTVAASQMAAGVLFAMQEAELDVQLDIHGPDAGDYAAIITTLFRDQYAIDNFGGFAVSGSAVVPLGFPTIAAGPFTLQAQNYSAVGPLHADDPKQIPFLNAEQQWENRWIVTARVQANQIVTVPQQFAGQVQITDWLADITPIAQSQTVPVS